MLRFWESVMNPPVYRLYIADTLVSSYESMEALREGARALITGEGEFLFTWRKVVISYVVTKDGSVFSTQASLEGAVTAAKAIVGDFAGDAGTAQIKIERVESLN